MDFSRLELRSQRLTLKAFAPADAAEAFAAITPDIPRFMSWEPPASEAELAAALASLGEQTKAGRAFDPVTIRLAATGEFLGLAGIHKLDTPEPEPGVWIKQARHGHGYGREAVAALIAWAAAKLGFASVIYPVAERNAPSRRLAEALGGVLVGRRPLVKPSGVAFKLVLYRVVVARSVPSPLAGEGGAEGVG
jgi:RimJ/RimL family protein N-acetyltransferase